MQDNPLGLGEWGCCVQGIKRYQRRYGIKAIYVNSCRRLIVRFSGPIARRNPSSFWTSASGLHVPSICMEPSAASVSL